MVRVRLREVHFVPEVRYTNLMYQRLKPLLFRADPERIHEQVMAALTWTSRHPGGLKLVSRLCQVEDKRLEVKRFGLTFPNPIGLAAGFDKNARAVPTWAALGFGHAEVGSVTAHAQPGNPKPRLFRLLEDEALINRMGFNNDGAAVMAKRLEQLRMIRPTSVPLGINLGKSKVTPLDDAPDDYLTSLAHLWSRADYFVINVSSPNTPGLRELQDKGRLETLLATVTAYAAAQEVRKPILLKIAPDLTYSQIDEIVTLVLEHELSGLIATNTTVSREGLRTDIGEAGGLSGRPVRARSLEILNYLRAQVGSSLPLISVGGVFSADDVFDRLRAGACSVQLYTSLVYEGPLLLKRLNEGVLKRMERDGFSNVEEVIGSS